ncbi:hypothetical protein LP419_16340 [Massilia sp. H-1]|nr:hypothetical protein LP419_16340 [Massilia sp. H-1]
MPAWRGRLLVLGPERVDQHQQQMQQDRDGNAQGIGALPHVARLAAYLKGWPQWAQMPDWSDEKWACSVKIKTKIPQESLKAGVRAGV